jgi:hypothetical protein
MRPLEHRHPLYRVLQLLIACLSSPSTWQSHVIITKVQTVRTADNSGYAWAGLRKFQNVDLVAARLMSIHNVPERYRIDVRKQALQIRYCLVQAREYFAAAAAVSLATKPNLLYYGTMSLALAEILFKQSGDSSLDRARDQNRRHGLTMSVTGAPKTSPLSGSSRLLRAYPMEINGDTEGYFRTMASNGTRTPDPWGVDALLW